MIKSQAGQRNYDFQDYNTKTNKNCFKIKHMQLNIDDNDDEAYPNNAQKELLKRWIDSSQTPHRNNKRYPKYPRHKSNGVKSQFHREHRQKDDGWPNKEGK
ncbi:12776_t:CDS:2, partial [Cetraspora pellucida]